MLIKEEVGEGQNKTLKTECSVGVNGMLLEVSVGERRHGGIFSIKGRSPHRSFCRRGLSLLTVNFQNPECWTHMLANITLLMYLYGRFYENSSKKCIYVDMY